MLMRNSREVHARFWVLLVLLWPSNVAFGQVSQQPKNVELVFQGMLTERLKLVSGRFEMKGSRRSTIGGSQNVEDGDLEITGAMASKGRVRFDKDSVGILIGDGLTSDGLPSGQRGRVSTKLFRTERVAGFWMVGQPNISISTPETQLIRTGGLFDPRALGLYSKREFDMGIGIEELISLHLTMKLVPMKLDSSGGKLWTVSCESLPTPNGEKSLFVLTIDVENGFTPTKSEISIKNRQGKTLPHQSSQVKWQQVNSVFVPIEYNSVVNIGSAFEELSLNITWSDVNGEIPDSLFDPSTFGAPDTTKVVTLGQPVVLKDRSMENLRINERQQRTRFAWTWKTAIAVLFALVAILMALRYRRSKFGILSG